jgi:hypothetical protein
MGVNARASFGPSFGIAHGRLAAAPPTRKADRPAAAETHTLIALRTTSREEKRPRVEPHRDLSVDAGEPGALHGRRYFGKGRNLSHALRR